MDFIDILIIISCAAGLIYFALDRIKYSNRNVLHKKLERLNELQTLLLNTKKDNSLMELLISSNNVTDFDNFPSDKLIEYRDNIEKLEFYENEYKEIKKYLKNVRMYNISGI
jgi:hypothetical protein